MLTSLCAKFSTHLATRAVARTRLPHCTHSAQALVLTEKARARKASYLGRATWRCAAAHVTAGSATNSYVEEAKGEESARRACYSCPACGHPAFRTTVLLRHLRVCCADAVNEQVRLCDKWRRSGAREERVCNLHRRHGGMGFYRKARLRSCWQAWRLRSHSYKPRCCS